MTRIMALGFQPLASKRAQQRRLDAARFALRAYVAIDENGITDLLTDLCHLCHAEDIDWEQCVRMAKMHFDAESETRPTQIFQFDAPEEAQAFVEGVEAVNDSAIEVVREGNDVLFYDADADLEDAGVEPDSGR